MSSPERIVDLRTPQTILREWVAEHLESEGEIVSGELFQKALLRFGGNRAFMNAIFELALPTLLDDAVKDVVSKNRPRVKPLGRGFATEEHIRALMSERIMRWYENARSGNYLPVLKMTRAELGHAIDQRERQIESQLTRIAFLRELYDGLEDDNQTPEERYTESELAEIWARHFAADEEGAGAETT